MQQCALTILSLVAILLGFGTASAEESKGDRPNFVVIFIDDMGFADPGCFGNPLIRTPHIDKLAAEGIKLTNFYVNSPICSASRVALTTGQYQGRWKIHSFLNTRAGNANRGMADYLDPSAPTTAKKLKAAGYSTAHFGKWHMGGGRDVDDAPLPQAYGFDESLVSFEGLGDRIISNPKGVERARALGHGKVIPCERWERMQIQTDRAIDFVRRHRDEPFYVRLFPNDVHDAHVPRPGSADKFKSVSDDPYVRDFFAVLEEMDEHIGRLVATIDELNLGQKTLILFTSDNGPTDWPKKYLTGPPAGFAGPYRGRKWSLFEGGIRMPFIARWTGTIPAGMEDNSSVRGRNRSLSDSSVESPEFQSRRILMVWTAAGFCWATHLVAPNPFSGSTDIPTPSSKAANRNTRAPRSRCGMVAGNFWSILMAAKPNSLTSKRMKVRPPTVFPNNQSAPPQWPPKSRRGVTTWVLHSITKLLSPRPCRRSRFSPVTNSFVL